MLFDTIISWLALGGFTGRLLRTSHGVLDRSEGFHYGVQANEEPDMVATRAVGNALHEAVPTLSPRGLPSLTISLSVSSTIPLPTPPFKIPPAPETSLPPGAPSSGSSPSAINQWWESLSTAQQSTFPLQWSAYIGSTNGIPAIARDRANRANLQYSYAVILNELDRLGSQPNSEEFGAIYELYRKKLVGMADLWTRIHDGKVVTGDIGPFDLMHKPGRTAQGTLYLMLFSTDGDGMWAVSIGNPDTADVIVLTVPGLGRLLDDFLFQDLSNNDAMMSEVWKKGGEMDSTAGIMWMGYDPPNNFVDFPENPLDAAVSAVPALRQFQEGLLATHKTGGGAPHITVVGHSYGSVVVGETTLLSMLFADDIILIASPGMPTKNARMMIDKSTTSVRARGSTQVWASITGFDAIALAQPLGGTNPLSSEFDAKLFESDKSGDHGGYWQTSGLSNMALIALGQYDSVTPFLPPVLSPSAGPTPVARSTPSAI